MTGPVIDSHQHFWDRSIRKFDYSWQESPEMAAIRRDRLPDDLRPQISAAGVSKTVLVQTQHNLAENSWALQLADQNDFVGGVVGWVDLLSADCQGQLEEFTSQPKFVGIRHITQDEPDDDFIVGDAVGRGLAVLQQQGIPFDLLFYARHLRHVPALAGRFPQLPMVIDHLSKPLIHDGSMDPWRTELCEAARFPNVYCKLSGLVTEADWENWSIDGIRPYFETALECFGPERLMYGSDWPVCELAASYQQVFDLTRELIGGLSDTEQARVLGGTAREFYGLEI